MNLQKAIKDMERKKRELKQRISQSMQSTRKHGTNTHCRELQRQLSQINHLGQQLGKIISQQRKRRG